MSYICIRTAVMGSVSIEAHKGSKHYDFNSYGEEPQNVNLTLTLSFTNCVDCNPISSR